MKNDKKISKVINDSQQLDQKPIISFPYYGDISENIKRLLNKFEARAVFRSGTKLNEFIKVFMRTLESNLVFIMILVHALDISSVL